MYWKSVFNLLEGQLEGVLVNARHIKFRAGRKTDVQDAQWNAELLQHGLHEALPRVRRSGFLSCPHIHLYRCRAENPPAGSTQTTPGGECGAAGKASITVEQLMSHQGGLSGFPDPIEPVGSRTGH